MHKDVFKQDIAVGQRVAFMLPRYRDLIIGTVSKLTPKRVRISYRYAGVDGTFVTPASTVVVHPEDVA